MGLCYQIGEISLNEGELTLTRGDRSVHLTRKAVEVLLALRASNGDPVGREELMKSVWHDVVVDEAALKQYVYMLRGAFRDLDPEREYIENIPRRGYRLTVPLVLEPSAPDRSRAGSLPVLVAPEPPASPQPRALRSRWVAVAATGILLVAVIFGYLAWRVSQKREAANSLVREGSILLRRANVPELTQARNRFEQALQLSPNLPVALAGLAEAFARGQNSSFDHARKLARESVRRDPRCAECRGILGYILMTRDWNWKEAEAELQQAWQLNPRDPQVRNWRAQWLAAHGRLPEAKTEAQACVSLDPTRPGSLALLASVHYFSGQYQEALREANNALGLHPRFQPAFKWRYRAHLLLGEDLKAITSRAQSVYSWSQASEEKILEIMSHWNQIYHSGGRKAVADMFLREVSEGLALDVQRYERAVWHMWIEDRIGALAELEAAVKARPYDLMYVAVDPVFLPLHGDPRFRQVVRQVGLDIPATR